MSDAVDACTVIRLNRNHKAIVANRDQLILDRFARLAHQAFECARYARAQFVNFVSYARELRAGAIVEFAVRQNLVCNARTQAAQLDRQISDQTPQAPASCRARRESKRAPTSRDPTTI